MHLEVTRVLMVEMQELMVADAAAIFLTRRDWGERERGKEKGKRNCYGRRERIVRDDVEGVEASGEG